MTTKKNASGRARAPRRAGAASRHTAEPSFGSRLRAAREALAIGRKEAARTLGWSESRLISYESDATQPNLSELEALAALFQRDRAWLAFGDAYAGAAGARSLGAAGSVWVPLLGGGELAVPASVVAGSPGPLLCVSIEGDGGFGLSSGDVVVVRSGETPAPGVAWAVRAHGETIRVGWVRGVGRGGVELQLDLLASTVSVGVDRLLGRLVATLRRAGQTA